MAFYDGAHYEGSIIAQDPEVDLALIKIDHTPGEVAVFRSAVGVGEDLGTFGFPMTDLLTKSGNFSRGSITGLAGIEDEPSRFQIQAPVQGGNSGGPVVDANESVIGIVVSGPRRSLYSVDDMPENTNFAIRSDVARKFAASHGIKVRFTAKELGRKTDWTQVAIRSQAMSVLLYCDQGYGDVPDAHLPNPLQSKLMSSNTMRRKFWSWIIVAIVAIGFSVLFMFRSQFRF